MWLAICEPADAAGCWAVAGLRGRGLPIELLEPDDIVRQVRLVHRVTNAGTEFELETRAGLAVRGGELRGVLNRLLAVPAGALETVSPADRAYVADEQGAAIASWLAGLSCPVLNRPTPGVLFGRWYPAPRWRQLADAVGLPAAPWRLDTRDEPEEPPAQLHATIVIGDEVIDPPDRALAAASRELARRTGLGLAGLTFAAADGGWRLLDATPLPDLRAGGDAALGALQHALTAA